MDASLIEAMHATRAAASTAVASALRQRAALQPNTRSSAATAVANGLNTPASALSRAAASRSATAPASTASSTANDQSTITSSDFLTLLVTELQNQDPTQPTDPNEYITQLVGVNSLEQLISINSGIQGLASTAASTAPASGSAVAAPGLTVPTTGSTAASQRHNPLPGAPAA